MPLFSKLLARHQDPVTGDDLSPLEYFTRQVQLGVRTPWFILAFCATTVLIFLGHGDYWNYFASWLAIVIEWLVGTYMLGQTKRDAVIIRTMLKQLMETKREVEADLQSRDEDSRDATSNSVSSRSTLS